MRSVPLYLTLPALLLVSACAPAGAHAHRARVVVVERPYTHVVVGRGHYWYRDGFYYRHAHGRYWLAPAPRGAVIATVPGAAISLHFGGARYRYFGGVYYRYTPTGYVVVERPTTVYVDAAAGAPETAFVEPAARTVDVHNSNGSVTPVRLEPEGAQWKGPKGELYGDFPTEAQLREAYGF